MNIINQGSCKSLFLKMRFSERVLSTGTGFIVNSSKGPHLITNRHNVTGRRQDNGECLDQKHAATPDEIVIMHNSISALGTWIPVVEPLYDDHGDPRWIEHPVLKASADFVALPLTKTEGIVVYPYDLENEYKLAYGTADIVSVIGFPFSLSTGGYFAIWATGFVASEPSINYNDLPMFLIDCRSRPGQSGSAVVASRNGGLLPLEDGSQEAVVGNVTRFLGIYSGRVNEQSDLGMVWKASAIKELVDSIKL